MPSQPPFHRSFSFDNDDDQGHFSSPPSYATYASPHPGQAQPSPDPLTPPPPPQHRNFDNFAPAATGAYDYRQSIATSDMDTGESPAAARAPGVLNDPDPLARALRSGGQGPLWDRFGAGR